MPEPEPNPGGAFRRYDTLDGDRTWERIVQVKLVGGRDDGATADAQAGNPELWRLWLDDDGEGIYGLYREQPDGTYAFEGPELSLEEWTAWIERQQTERGGKPRIIYHGTDLHRRRRA